MNEAESSINIYPYEPSKDIDFGADGKYTFTCMTYLFLCTSTKHLNKIRLHSHKSGGISSTENLFRRILSHQHIPFSILKTIIKSTRRLLNILNILLVIDLPL